MSESVYRQVLGSDIDQLPDSLRSYFNGGAVGRGQGVFDVAGTRIRLFRPLLSMMAKQRILFPEYATNVAFDIINSPTDDGSLNAVRTFHFPGRERPLEDSMRVVDGYLHDFMGRRRGFEVRMLLTIVNDGLVMRSDRQWLNLGRVRVPLPRVARVTVTESTADDKQHVDVRLHSPLIGDWFRYSGSFSYQYDTSGRHSE
jgi:Domain of unknown function (DUF4166)